MQEAFAVKMEEFDRQFARRPGFYHLFFGHFGVAGARNPSRNSLFLYTVRSGDLV
jgi:hypothetical protein